MWREAELRGKKGGRRKERQGEKGIDNREGESDEGRSCLTIGREKSEGVREREMRLTVGNISVCASLIECVRDGEM